MGQRVPRQPVDPSNRYPVPNAQLTILDAVNIILSVAVLEEDHRSILATAMSLPFCAGARHFAIYCLNDHGISLTA